MYVSIYPEERLTGQLKSKGLQKENISLGSQEDAGAPELKFGDDKLRELGHGTHWCSCM
jgi:hypothetical protein